MLFDDGLLRVVRQAEPEAWLFRAFNAEPQVVLERPQVLMLAAVLLADAAGGQALRIGPA